MRAAEPRNVFRFCAVTFAIAWVLRLILALATDRFHNFTRMDMERVALSLARTGVMGNPYHTPTGPSAILPPGYVLFLAAVFHLFGTGVLAEVVKVVTCTAASSLRCALMPWLAWRFGLAKPVMVASALVSIFWIGAFDTELQGEWDTAYTTLLLILLTCLHYVRPLLGAPLRWALTLGVLWGAAALINPTILSVLAGFLVLEAWRGGRAQWFSLAQRALAITACMIVILFPWALRNRLVLGNWIWLRSGFGLEMKLSYRPGSSWANAWNIRPSLQHPDQPNRDSEISPHPFINAAESRRIQQIGEVAYSQQKLQEALEWIRQNPRQSLVLVAQHAFYFWFPPGPHFYNFRPGKATWIYSLARWGLTILAFCGWFLLWCENRPVALHLGAILCFFPLIYYLVNWSSRYRMPIEWLLVLLAAVALATVWEHYRMRQRQPAAASAKVL